MNKANLQSQGFALASVWGGPQKVRYYAPDGRVKEEIPEIRERQDGVVYDVLLAQGYTLTLPENPKPHCDGCGNWHNTGEEVKQCIGRKRVNAERWERFAKKKLKQADTQALEDKISRLEEQLGRLLAREEKTGGSLNGFLLQREANETELSKTSTEHRG